MAFPPTLNLDEIDPKKRMRKGKEKGKKKGPWWSSGLERQLQTPITAREVRSLNPALGKFFQLGEYFNS